MLLRKLLMIVAVSQTLLMSVACNPTADNPEDGLKMLISSSKWTIDEITVNDAVTFKNGKMIKQFGGIDFERYMETVIFKDNGNFEGYFNGEAKPMLLRWKLNKTDVSIVAADNEKGAGWTISPGDITSKSFTMKTQSTAYDYPRMTRIALKFRQD